jgi:hypothetical protein
VTASTAVVGSRRTRISRVGVEGTSQCDALPLTAGEVAAEFLDPVVETAVDEVEQLVDARGCEHLGRDGRVVSCVLDRSSAAERSSATTIVMFEPMVPSNRSTSWGCDEHPGRAETPGMGGQRSQAARLRRRRRRRRCRSANHRRW